MSETAIPSDHTDAPSVSKIPPTLDPWFSKEITLATFARTGTPQSRVEHTRGTPATLFGTYDEEAPMAARLMRILDMSPFVRGLTDGPGIFVDSQLTKLKAMARAIAEANPKFPAPLIELRRRHEAFVRAFEMQLEAVIRAHVSGDKQAYERLCSAANWSVGGGALQQPSRREIDKAEAWTAERFIGRLIAWGVTIRRDGITGGLSFSAASALLPADREVLNDRARMAELELYLGQHPELCEPAEAPPPPSPIVQIEKEPAEIEATPATSDEAIGARVAEDIEPAEVVVQHADVAVEVQQTAEPITADQNERMANPSAPATPTTAESKKRRHRYAHISTLRNS